jgi:hypothetical protein
MAAASVEVASDDPKAAAITSPEARAAVVAAVIQNRHVEPVVAVVIADSDRARVIPGQESYRRAEPSHAVAEQYFNQIIATVADDQIGPAVAVEISQGERPEIGAEGADLLERIIDRLCEIPGPGAEEYRQLVIAGGRRDI